MNETYDNKIKEHIDYMLTLNRNDFIDYAFDKYKEYENDFELSSFFLMQIGKKLFGIKGNNLRNMLTTKVFDRKYIKEALYKYYYEGQKSFRGPLNNILGEILNENITKPYIEPYMHLLILLLYKKEEVVSKKI